LDVLTRHPRGVGSALLSALAAMVTAHDGLCARPPPGESEPRALASSLEAQVRRAEYQPSLQRGVLSAPNRAHGLRVRWEPTGTRVEDRTSGRHLATLRTVRVGRGDGAFLSPADAALAAGRVVRTWGDVAEWWVNDEAGVEQGWTVERAPPGVGPLRVEVAVEGATARADGDALHLESPAGRALAYGGIKAWDATGLPLATAVVPREGGWYLEVDDAHATYPVTVDPLLTAAAWTAEPNQVDAQFGDSVSSAGDVNGDGFSDVIVGANTFDDGELNEGAAFVFFGSLTAPSSTAAWTAESNPVAALFGASAASAGDVNGDGFSDVIVGAERYAISGPTLGRAFVFLGSATGLAPSPSWTADGTQQGAAFGGSVSSAGDVNGDGLSDVIVGSSFFTTSQMNAGKVSVYLGDAMGLGAGPRWTAESSQALALFGSSVAGAGDVNGDGFSDIAVGAPGGPGGGQGVIFLGGDGRPGRALGLRQRLAGAVVGVGARVTQPLTVEMQLVDSVAGLHRVRLEAEVNRRGSVRRRRHGGFTIRASWGRLGHAASPDSGAVPVASAGWGRPRPQRFSHREGLMGVLRRQPRA
jgi:hypothetical protein